MKVKDVIKKTIETYNRIAKKYNFYNKDKLMQYQLNYFISLLPKNALILDAGCGTGRDAKYLSDEGCKVVGIDISDGMLEEAKSSVKQADFKKMDLLDLKFNKDEFDGIWAMASLFHIPKTELNKGLKGIHNVLKKSGVFYLSVKEGEGEKIVNDEKYDNDQRLYVFYTQEELESLIKKNKFNIIKSEVSVNRGHRWVEIFCKKI